MHGTHLRVGLLDISTLLPTHRSHSFDRYETLANFLIDDRNRRELRSFVPSFDAHSAVHVVIPDAMDTITNPSLQPIIERAWDVLDRMMGSKAVHSHPPTSSVHDTHTHAHSTAPAPTKQDQTGPTNAFSHPHEDDMVEHKRFGVVFEKYSASTSSIHSVDPEGVVYDSTLRHGAGDHHHLVTSSRAVGRDDDEFIECEAPCGRAFVKRDDSHPMMSGSVVRVSDCWFIGIPQSKTKLTALMFALHCHRRLVAHFLVQRNREVGVFRMTPTRSPNSTGVA